MSSQFSRFSRIRSTSVLALVALAACALVPKEPITQQPMTARPPAAPLNSASPGAIYNAGYAGRPLFEDQRPRNTGDIITIVIAENVNATKSSAASAARNASEAFAVPVTPGIFGGLFHNTNLNASGSNGFNGTGGASAANTFNGTLTVTVTGVMPNGNLQVSGEKQMLINQGNEFVRFSGVVNPTTISGSNTVFSTQVADAKIEYSAKGYINEAQNMGWLQRFFLNLAPF
ncbi:flagellar basal body L-ring protein FlgH [Caballeronia mineralivorans]|uniref:flagellar basal body L-ring protein FlgH n=1 Tax=Caballeronia mineralivorans TaxID=2010198 RepID=UPI0023F27C99|nr:flagellar basal body L-ring protein FlgH [Caballeronia mineralivorans]MDB5787139.1 Flagellar L-ring protein [Caballeronia mineralivorans]